MKYAHNKKLTESLVYKMEWNALRIFPEAKCLVLLDQQSKTKSIQFNIIENRRTFPSERLQPVMFFFGTGD